MKKIFSILSIAAIAASCGKEVPPVGLQLSNGVQFKDTTYITTNVPAAQQKNIFVEEFTGVRCAGCPAGTQILKQIQASNPNRVIVAKIHSNFLAAPVKATDPDFRTPDAENLSLGLDVSFKPIATIDRLLNSTSSTPIQLFEKNTWQGIVSTQLQKSTPVNIDLDKTYDANTKTVNFNSKFTFTNAYSGNDLAFSIYVVENKLVAAQDSASVEIDEYEHEEVLRKIVTPLLTGTALTGTFENGRVIEKTLSIKLPDNVKKPENVDIIVFVHKQNKGEVLHAKHIKI